MAEENTQSISSPGIALASAPPVDVDLEEQLMARLEARMAKKMAEREAEIEARLQRKFQVQMAEQEARHRKELMELKLVVDESASVQEKPKVLDAMQDQLAEVGTPASHSPLQRNDQSSSLSLQLPRTLCVVLHCADVANFCWSADARLVRSGRPAVPDEGNEGEAEGWKRRRYRRGNKRRGKCCNDEEDSEQDDLQRTPEEGRRLSVCAHPLRSGLTALSLLLLLWCCNIQSSLTSKDLNRVLQEIKDLRIITDEHQVRTQTTFLSSCSCSSASTAYCIHLSHTVAWQGRLEKTEEVVQDLEEEQRVSAHILFTSSSSSSLIPVIVHQLVFCGDIPLYSSPCPYAVRPL